MRLFIYLVAVSAIYALLVMTAPRAAETVLVFFVGLLLVPVIVDDGRRVWKRHK